MADEFVTIPLDSDPDVLYQEAVERIQQTWPDFEPNPGQLGTVLMLGWAYMFSSLAVLASSMPEEAFQQAGKTLFSTPPQEAAPAQVGSTWTAIDNRGYKIDAGTEVVIAETGDELHGFTVLTEVVIAPGATATATGEVMLSAIIPGEQANDLTANADPVDSLDWISSIVLDGTTSGGEDAETPTDYSNRLRKVLQLLTPRPIIPTDFEIAALQIVGVERALAVDGYNPADRTSNNERMVTVAVIDESGNAVSAPIKAEVEADLEAKREVNFVVHVVDPNYTVIDASARIKAQPGFSDATVIANVEAALTNYFDPANWGLPTFGDPSSSGGWRLTTFARFYEVVDVMNQAQGVDYIETPQIAVGGGALGTADVALTGPAPLTRVGRLTITAV